MRQQGTGIVNSMLKDLATEPNYQKHIDSLSISKTRKLKATDVPPIVATGKVNAAHTLHFPRRSLGCKSFVCQQYLHDSSVTFKIEGYVFDVTSFNFQISMRFLKGHNNQ